MDLALTTSSLSSSSTFFRKLLIFFLPVRLTAKTAVIQKPKDERMSRILGSVAQTRRVQQQLGHCAMFSWGTGSVLMREELCHNESGSSFVNISLVIVCSVLGIVMTPLGIFLAINQSNTLWLVNMSLPGFFSLLVGLFL